MDLCRAVIVAVLSLALLQMSERLRYDAHGWTLAAAPGVIARA